MTSAWTAAPRVRRRTGRTRSPLPRLRRTGRDVDASIDVDASRSSINNSHPTPRAISTAGRSSPPATTPTCTRSATGSSAWTRSLCSRHQRPRSRLQRSDHGPGPSRWLRCSARILERSRMDRRPSKAAAVIPSEGRAVNPTQVAVLDAVHRRHQGDDWWGNTIYLDVAATPEGPWATYWSTSSRPGAIGATPTSRRSCRSAPTTTRSHRHLVQPLGRQRPRPLQPHLHAGSRAEVAAPTAGVRGRSAVSHLPVPWSR